MGRTTVPKHVHVLIPRTRDYATSLDGWDFPVVMAIKDLELGLAGVGGVSWLIRWAHLHHVTPYEGVGLSWLRSKGDF